MIGLEIDIASRGGSNSARMPTSKFASTPASLSEFNVDNDDISFASSTMSSINNHERRRRSDTRRHATRKRGRKHHNVMTRFIVNQGLMRMKTNHSFQSTKNPLVANVSAVNARKTR